MSVLRTNLNNEAIVAWHVRRPRSDLVSIHSLRYLRHWPVVTQQRHDESGTQLITDPLVGEQIAAPDGDRNKKLFQFLNELGARALRMHLGRLLEMTESSTDRLTYERKVTDRFGGQHEFDFAMTASTA